MTAEINPPTSPSATHRRASLKVLSRNVDKVALGNLIFPTWYYSPYPDSIIHDQDSSENTIKSEQNSHGVAALRQDSKQRPASRERVNGTSGSNSGLRHDHNSILHEKSVVDMLHVCPYCFRYTRSSTDFAGHMMLHIKAESDYYPHTSASNQTRRSRRRRSISTPASGDDGDAPRPVPDTAVKVYSYNGYTVWDVDGEVEKLYCQNLSLFGKLFLESKSVFFDTSGFHYFVLTYCPPALSSSTTATKTTTSQPNDDPDNPKPVSPRGTRGNKGASTSVSPTLGRKRKISTSMAEEETQTRDDQESAKHPTLDQPKFPLRHQVLGFFSKENLSWDANNLACILVFPPYQHRNLGQLLMAVSYKLSGWEWEDSIIGGPEKPLSTMGRKSYLRFWSERVARFIMGQSQDAEGLRVFEEGVMQEMETEDGEVETVMTGKKRKRKHGKGFVREELSIKELGDRTGMLGEDVVAALVEMGVCDLVIPSKKKQQQQYQQQQLQHPLKPHHPTSVTNSSHGHAATGMDNKTITAAAANTNTHTHTNATAYHAQSMSKGHDLHYPAGSTATNDQRILSVTVNRSKVLDWAKTHGVDLVNPVKEEGFLGEWALSEEDEEEENNDNDHEGHASNGDPEGA